MTAEPLTLTAPAALPAEPASGRSAASDRRARTFLLLALCAAAMSFLVMPPVYLLAAFHRLAGADLKPQVLGRVAVSCACNFGVTLCALRARGRLDQRLVELCSLVLAIHGSVALITQVGRFFYSIPMMLVSVVVSFLFGMAAIWLRGSLVRQRVGVLGPWHEVLDDPNLDCLRLEPTAPVFEQLDLILLTGGVPDDADGRRLLMKALLAGKRVRHVAEFQEEAGGACDPGQFEIDSVASDQIARYQPIKRALDIALVILALPFAVPIGLAGALAVRMSMGAPVLFVQPRVGLGGEVFRILKLRTMAEGRITPLGAFLRRFRIDELPQFLNVLRGEMSFVGPRPEMVSIAAQYAHTVRGFSLRHLVRPGITGWAQVRASPAYNTLETQAKVRFDLYYLKYFSFGLDLQILVRTVWTLIEGGGVR